MQQMWLWKVQFEILVEGMATWTKDECTCVGTDDLNKLQEHVRHCIMQSPVDVTFSPHLIAGIVGADQMPTSQNRAIADFHVVAMTRGEQVTFIDTASLVEAGILSFEAVADATEIPAPSYSGTPVSSIGTDTDNADSSIHVSELEVLRESLARSIE